MMVRTQITLDSELQRRARERAAELGISLAEYVRRLVARDVERSAAKATFPPFSVSGVPLSRISVSASTR